MKQVYDIAARDSGTWEWIDGHNPKVVKYFADVGHDWVKDDETAWCAAFVGAMLKRAGYPHTGALNARSYLDWGEAVDPEQAQPGDVVVLWRSSPDSWKGHVGFFHAWRGDKVALLGGNQNNQVNVAEYPADRVLGVRRMEKAPRTTKAASTTLQATAGGAVAVSGGVLSALGQLDPAAQVALVVAGVVALAAFAWIARERLRRWAKGDR